MLLKILCVILALLLCLILNGCGNKNGEANTTVTSPEPANTVVEHRLSQTSGPVTYNSYFNPRYGFTITYPGSFRQGQEPTNGDGLTFTSADHESTLTASGVNNVLNDTVGSYVRNNLSQLQSKVKYNSSGNDWMVVSWVDGGKIFYAKEYIGTGSEAGFVFSYPESQASYYNPIADHISKYFTPGDLSQGH